MGEVGARDLSSFLSLDNGSSVGSNRKGKVTGLSRRKMGSTGNDDSRPSRIPGAGSLGRRTVKRLSEGTAFVSRAWYMNAKVGTHGSPILP